MAGLGLPHAGCYSNEALADQVDCEEAVARLEECCGPIGSELGCANDGGEACSGGMRPDLDTAQSVCLRELSCNEIRARGMCEAVRTPETREEVCRNG
jgi:hypothetical protein